MRYTCTHTSTTLKGREEIQKGCNLHYLGTTQIKVFDRYSRIAYKMPILISGAVLLKIQLKIKNFGFTLMNMG